MIYSIIRDYWAKQPIYKFENLETSTINICKREELEKEIQRFLTMPFDIEFQEISQYELLSEQSLEAFLREAGLAEHLIDHLDYLMSMDYNEPLILVRTNESIQFLTRKKFDDDHDLFQLNTDKGKLERVFYHKGTV